MGGELKSKYLATPLSRDGLRRKRGRKPGPKTPFDEPAVVDFAFLYLQDRIPARATDLYSEPLVAFARRIEKYLADEFGIVSKLGEDQLVEHAKRLIKEFVERRNKAG